MSAARRGTNTATAACGTATTRASRTAPSGTTSRISRLARISWWCGAILAFLTFVTGSAPLGEAVLFAFAYAAWCYGIGSTWRWLRRPREPKGPRLVK